MLNILSRSIARTGGIEVADHISIEPRPKPVKSAKSNPENGKEMDMTTNAKFSRYVKLDETIGTFIKRAGQLASAFSRYRARKSARKVLSRLDDRLLGDIGLHRGMLREAADGFVGRRAANDNAGTPRSVA